MISEAGKTVPSETLIPTLAATSLATDPAPNRSGFDLRSLLLVASLAGHFFDRAPLPAPAAPACLPPSAAPALPVSYAPALPLR